MAVARALILGGTGMLAGCAESLVHDGWRVVLPSRRYVPIPAHDGDNADDADNADDGDARHSGRRALWVEADWSQPAELAQKAAKALDGPADLLVAWVHDAYRTSVLRAVAGLLAPGAPVVEVHGSDGSVETGTIGGVADPVLAEHPTQRVVLGRVGQGRGSRWLTHAEIVRGVQQAIDRALAGRPATLLRVGE